ncbi:SMI1/KNR4 family protein [Gorillibacterium sp. CAU 1737]|uniref:SMI1/KNR4 family protein n=1 Tax=Gorillibacterium sp. CAU 1737 TaxID=3140362 RepID=UPI0032607CF3
MSFFTRWRKKKEHPITRPSFAPLSPEHATYLRQLVQRAGMLDPNREVFGSAKHQYQLNPVLPLDEVRKYEERHQVQLPEEYVFFLTQVGNGGAGPYYGIYSLERTGSNEEYTRICGQPAWINEAMTKESWAEKMNLMEDADDDTYDRLHDEVFGGLNLIGTQGCTYDNLLMNTGSWKGKMVYIDWNLEPEYGPFFTGMGFLDWYEGFFQELIAGHRLSSYGYVRLGSEDELIVAYREAAEEEQDSILWSFFRFPAVRGETLQFLKGIEDERHQERLKNLLEHFEKQMAGKR